MDSDLERTSKITYLMKLYILPVLLVAFLRVLSSVVNIPVRYFTMDPAATVHEPFYIGFFSNLGLAIWATAAAVSLFASAVLGKREGARLLLSGGFISAIFFFDDMYMFHEQVFPNYLAVSQNIILALYGLGMIAFLVHFRKEILKSRFHVLVVALAFLGISVMVDILDHFISFPSQMLLEDGTKFIGLWGWCLYFVGFAKVRLSECLAVRSQAGDR